MQVSHNLDQGWCWLSINNGELEISKTPNAESPVMNNIKPILGCDVWEHSYYLDYKNKRPEYLEEFFDKLINWEFGTISKLNYL